MTKPVAEGADAVDVGAEAVEVVCVDVDAGADVDVADVVAVPARH